MPLAKLLEVNVLLSIVRRRRLDLRSNARRDQIPHPALNR